MIEYTSTKLSDLLSMSVQPAQIEEIIYVRNNPDDAGAMIQNSLCLTGWVGGSPVAVAGFARMGEYKHTAWAFFAPGAGPYMLGITRKAKAMIASLSTPRIDMAINVGFTQGERFAEILGLTKETITPLRKYGVLGEDQNIYAKVRDDDSA